MIKFHEKLTTLIYEAGYKGRIKEFAYLYGISKESTNPSSLISQYMRGERIPPLRALKKLAKVLNKKAFELIEGTDYPHILDEPSHKVRGRVPFVPWYEVKNIKKNPGFLKNHEGYIDYSYHKEDDLYATEVPEFITLGISTSLFSPKDYLLISPTKEPIHEKPIIIRKEHWLTPEYVIFSLAGETRGYKYPGESRPRRIHDDLHICGVVVARISNYIQK